MKIKTVEVIKKENIDINLTKQDIIDCVIERLMKERPDLKGKNSKVSVFAEGGPLGFLTCGINDPFLTLKMEISE